MTVEYAQQFNNQNVVAIRDAHVGDPGFDREAKEGEQLVATLADGSVVTIKRSQLTSHAPAGSSAQPAQPNAPSAKPATK
jgi:hypothetical protein